MTESAESPVSVVQNVETEESPLNGRHEKSEEVVSEAVIVPPLPLFDLSAPDVSDDQQVSAFYRQQIAPAGQFRNRCPQRFGQPGGAGAAKWRGWANPNARPRMASESAGERAEKKSC